MPFCIMPATSDKSFIACAFSLSTSSLIFVGDSPLPSKRAARASSNSVFCAGLKQLSGPLDVPPKGVDPVLSKLFKAYKYSAGILFPIVENKVDILLSEL